MFRPLLIFASLLPSLAVGQTLDVGGSLKDLIIKEAERRAPVREPSMVFDLPEKSPSSYNHRWRISGRAGPFTYRDELGDGQDPKVKIRLGSLKQFRFEIRKDF